MDIKEYEIYCRNNGVNFMQSACWAKIKSNWLSEYITVRDKSNRINGTCLVLVRRIPIINTAMLYAPRGFVCDMQNKTVVDRILSQIKLIAKKYNAYTLKIDPMIDEDDYESIKILTDLGFEYHVERVGYDNVQCRENYLLSLENKSEEEIFLSFKPKWRYNIRLAGRKGVKCGFYGKEKLEDFYSLMKLTGKRDKFAVRSKEYFERILAAFGDSAKLCMCYLGDSPLSGALLINYAGTASYVYGCSSNEYRNCMPNHLMQWTMIKYAKQSGCSTYDFCGIPYWYDKTHKNYGVYKFKQGFNGFVKNYAGEFDYTFRPSLQHCASIALSLKKNFSLAVEQIKHF